MKDIIDIYNGRIKNWKKLSGPDLEITVLGREEGDSSRSTIEEVYPEFKKKYRNEITIVVRDKDLISNLKTKKGAIGFRTLANMKDGKLNVFSVNNLIPGTKNFNIMNAFVYFENKLSASAKKFLDFVYGEKGRDIITLSFCEPVKE